VPDVASAIPVLRFSLCRQSVETDNPRIGIGRCGEHRQCLFAPHQHADKLAGVVAAGVRESKQIADKPWALVQRGRDRTEEAPLERRMTRRHLEFPSQLRHGAHVLTQPARWAHVFDQLAHDRIVEPCQP